MGVPPVLIHFIFGLSNINHPFVWSLWPGKLENLKHKVCQILSEVISFIIHLLMRWPCVATELQSCGNVFLYKHCFAISILASIWKLCKPNEQHFTLHPILFCTLGIFGHCFENCSSMFCLDTHHVSWNEPWILGTLQWNGAAHTLKVEILAEITLEPVSDSGLMDTLAESMEEFNLPPLPNGAGPHNA